jgi:hypothetical protein
MDKPTGCGDNSCEFMKPTGMATNGGCRCIDWRNYPIEDRRKILTAIRYYRKLASQSSGTSDGR